MADSKDYYQILGLTKSSSADDIKKAYRKLAMQYHPDRNKTKEGEAKFKEVTKAYEVLSNPQKKQQYDQFGHAAFEQGAGQGPFGGGGGPFGGQQGPFTYSYSSNGQNGDFGGFSDPFDIFEQFFGGGFGNQRARRPVYSLTISFDEAVHGKRFGREGYDIVTEEELSYAEVALGVEISVKTIEGDVKIKVPGGTQPGTLIRLSGRGVPRLRGGGKGDHYVKVKVVVPKKLGHKEKQILEDLLKEEKGESSKKSWF